MGEKNNEYHFQLSGRIAIVRSRSLEGATAFVKDRYPHEEPELIAQNEELKY